MEKVRVSIIIAILNSHEVVRRQILHFSRMSLPDTVEFIFVDDGSTPELTGEMKNLRWFYTHDKRPWTQGLARNLGASYAQGVYYLFTDIDHIITKEAIDDVLRFDGDKMVFRRYYGILDRQGNIICDKESMLQFGLNPMFLSGHRGMCAGYHGNTYAVRNQIFKEIGGYDPRVCQSCFHVGGRYKSEESRFNSRYKNHPTAKRAVQGSNIYVFPIGRFRTDKDNNPFGLFHGLSLEQGHPLPMME